jgi:hypothetical protein
VPLHNADVASVLKPLNASCSGKLRPSEGLGQKGAKYNFAPTARGRKGREVQLRAYGVGARLSPAGPKPATFFGTWGVVANYAVGQ